MYNWLTFDWVSWDKCIYHYSFVIMFEPQITQTAHTFYIDRLSRPIVSRHAMLRFRVMFFYWHLTAICCIQGLSFTTFKKNTPILKIKQNVYEYCLILKILHFLFQGSISIPEYRCLLIVRVQYLYIIEHAVENIAYYRCS